MHVKMIIEGLRFIVDFIFGSGEEVPIDNHWVETNYTWRMHLLFKYPCNKGLMDLQGNWICSSKWGFDFCITQCAGGSILHQSFAICNF
jgi:hypothetical protein